jgi:hypothetical protein
LACANFKEKFCEVLQSPDQSDIFREGTVPSFGVDHLIFAFQLLEHAADFYNLADLLLLLIQVLTISILVTLQCEGARQWSFLIVSCLHKHEHFFLCYDLIPQILDSLYATVLNFSIK